MNAHTNEPFPTHARTHARTHAASLQLEHTTRHTSGDAIYLRWKECPHVYPGRLHAYFNQCGRDLAAVEGVLVEHMRHDQAAHGLADVLRVAVAEFDAALEVSVGKCFHEFDPQRPLVAEAQDNIVFGRQRMLVVGLSVLV